MTLSGRNGAGKSTLLRVLAGELTPDSGGVVFEKGAKVALHDQRPPRDSETSLGDYVFSGRADVIALEGKLERLERAMSDGDHSTETMSAYSDAQARLELAGGYRWRDDVLAVLAGLGFDPSQSERSLRTFSGGELTRASLARSLAARPGAPAPRRADQPPRHPLAGVAGGVSHRSRRGGRPRRSRSLVPRGRRHLGTGIGGGSRPLLLRAPGTPGAPSRRHARSRSARRSSGRRRRSPAWRSSSSASATRRRRRSRPSRGSSRSTGSRPTPRPATPATSASSASRSRSRSGRGGSSSRWRAPGSRSRGGRSSRTGPCGSSAASTSSSSAPTAPARRR